MKYLTQFLIIMGFTLAGEALQRLIPLPIPASVYGLALLFLALCLKLVKVEMSRGSSLPVGTGWTVGAEAGLLPVFLRVMLLMEAVPVTLPSIV